MKSIPCEDTSSYQLAVARIAPAPQPTKARIPRPDDPIPRKPPSHPSSRSRDLRRLSSANLAAFNARVPKPPIAVPNSLAANLGSSVRLGKVPVEFKVPQLPPKEPKTKPKEKGKGRSVEKIEVDVFNVGMNKGTKRKRAEEVESQSQSQCDAGETETSTERDNKNRIKRTTHQQMSVTSMQKSNPEYKEVFNYIYRAFANEGSSYCTLYNGTVSGSSCVTLRRLSAGRGETGPRSRRRVETLTRSTTDRGMEKAAKHTIARGSPKRAVLSHSTSLRPRSRFLAQAWSFDMALSPSKSYIYDLSGPTSDAGPQGVFPNVLVEPPIMVPTSYHAGDAFLPPLLTGTTSTARSPSLSSVSSDGTGVIIAGRSSGRSRDSPIGVSQPEVYYSPKHTYPPSMGSNDSLKENKKFIEPLPSVARTSPPVSTTVSRKPSPVLKSQPITFPTTLFPIPRRSPLYPSPIPPISSDTPPLVTAHDQKSHADTAVRRAWSPPFTPEVDRYSSVHSSPNPEIERSVSRGRTRSSMFTQLPAYPRLRSNESRKSNRGSPISSRTQVEASPPSSARMSATSPQTAAASVVMSGSFYPNTLSNAFPAVPLHVPPPPVYINHLPSRSSPGYRPPEVVRARSRSRSRSYTPPPIGVRRTRCTRSPPVRVMSRSSTFSNSRVPNPWYYPPPAPPPFPRAWANPCPNIEPKFNFEDGNVTFAVKDTSFKVHRHFFDQNSSIMKQLIDSAFGSRYSGPCYTVTLSGVEPRDFEQLLTIFYPSDYSQEDTKTVEDWASVLRVANHFVMRKISKLAKTKLCAMASPVDRIALAKEFEDDFNDEWVTEAFLELVTRSEALTSEEGHKIGLENVIRLGTIKQALTNNLKEYLDMGKVKKLVGQELVPGV
ncbi:hypothetical protein VNI00_004152 [Paramarasmius palmivorus]|uniref:BTB domain-containing protein n=1 Tax=Paramarasmius palmivorus TaxID=297713 RepID=A0AAW0DNT7_9AGAR